MPASNRSLAALVALLSCSVGALEICGNYCGPTWCDGAAITECPTGGKSCQRDASTCTESGPTDGSCADECCKKHDACCGSDDRTGCNDAIISCLKACPSGPGSPGKTCYRGSIPVPVDAVLAGMELDPYGCCGTSCYGDSVEKVPKRGPGEDSL